MQFIPKKNSPPADWDNWFTVTIDGVAPKREFDFRALQPHHLLKDFLLSEQNGLCAYCQREIRVASSTIEHVIPYSSNKPISTIYHNLVLSCANAIADDGRLHCDKSRGNALLPPIIFYEDFSRTDGTYFKYLIAEEDGTINIKSYGNDIDWNVWMQLRVFIDILNLNHANLVQKRQETLTRWRLTTKDKPARLQKAFWKAEFDAIDARVNQPFRQFFLIYLKNKIKTV